MKKLARTLALLAVAACCLAPSMIGATAPKVAPKGARLEVLIYDQGNPARRGVLPAGSDGAAALDSLLEKKRGRWKSSWVTYAPVVYIKSDDFTINISGNLMIVNCGDRRGRPVQVTAHLTAEESRQAVEALTKDLGQESGRP